MPDDHGSVTNENNYRIRNLREIFGGQFSYSFYLLKFRLWYCLILFVNHIIKLFLPGTSFHRDVDCIRENVHMSLLAFLIARFYCSTVLVTVILQLEILVGTLRFFLTLFVWNPQLGSDNNQKEENINSIFYVLVQEEYE